MTEKRSVLFILDGMPSRPGPCGISECFEPAIGVYEIVDADEPGVCYGAVELCKQHGEKMATGPAS